MLTELHIQNYALIKDSSFRPNEGLNTLTGETGAGKSILLGALGLITGKRADTSVLFDKESKCVVEANFNLKNHRLEPLFDQLDLDFEVDTIIRREINSAGKSRAFVNDTPVNLDSLKKLGVFLIDVHSQNETNKLNAQNYQSNILDLLTDSKDALFLYKEQYNLVSKLKKELTEFASNAEKEKADLDYNLFLLNELKTVQLGQIDTEQLEQDVKTIENFSEIKSLLSGLYNLVDEGEYAVSNILGEATSLSKELNKLSSEYSSIDERFQTLFVELQDLSKDLANANDRLELDEDTAEEKIETYNKLQNLLKKHNCESSSELLTIQEGLEDKTQKASNIEVYISELEVKITKEGQRLTKLGEKLHKSRNSNSKEINSKISNLCSELGVPDAVFEHDFQKLDEPSSNGLYLNRFLFSANKGVTSEEISKVASGGEFSRLMFALKSLLAQKTSLPTIIFDEIDTGISGEIALKMGKLMQEMSDEHQLICITHLPQIASKGKHHFFVYKDNTGNRTISNIRKLNDSERVEKIAEMIEGTNPSESALKSADALLSS